MTASLDHLFTDAPRKGRVSRCVVCGAPRTARIQAQIARLDRMARPLQGQSRSVSVTVCDEHAADVWEQVTAALVA